MIPDTPATGAGQTMRPAAGRNRQDTAETAPLDLGRILRTLWQGKWLIALVTLVVVTLAIYQAYVRAVPQFNAQTVVVLQQDGPQLVDFQSVVTDLTGGSDEASTQIEILRSRNLIAKVVDQLDLVSDPAFNPVLRDPTLRKRLIRTIQERVLPLMGNPYVAPDVPDQARQVELTVTNVIGALSIQSMSSALVFSIGITTNDRQKSALITDTLAATYIADQLNVKSAATVQATQWLADRVGEQAVALSAAEKAVQDFRAQTELVSPEALAAMQRQAKGFRDRITELQGQRTDLEDRLALLGEPAATRAAMIAGDATLTARLGEMPQNPAAAEAAAARTRADIARLDAQIGAIETSLTRLTDQIEAQSADLIALDQLTREATAKGVLYTYFLNRLNETSVQQGIQQPDSRIISNAVVPLEASSPRRDLILAAGMMLGLMLGAVWVLLREARADGFRTAEDLENFTGYTVMGQIPQIKRHARSKLVKTLQDTTTTAVSEAVRNLRTSLLLAGGAVPPQVIMLTSSVPAEGKTTMAISLAHNLGLLGHRVLVIEGDLRRRVFSEYFTPPTGDGLMAAIEGTQPLEELLVRNSEIKADVLMGAESQLNAADVYQSRKFQTFVEGLRKTYDFIVIDSPPVLAVSDARIIARFADAVLYVVHWDKTTHDQVNAGLAMFESIGQPVNGLVLSQINQRGMQRYGYGGRYGTGSSYYGSKT